MWPVFSSKKCIYSEFGGKEMLRNRFILLFCLLSLSLLFTACGGGGGGGN